MVSARHRRGGHTASSSATLQRHPGLSRGTAALDGGVWSDPRPSDSRGHLIGDVLRKHLRPQFASAAPAVPADVAAEFHTSATLGLLAWWIDHDFCNGPQWLTAPYRTLAVP